MRLFLFCLFGSFIQIKTYRVEVKIKKSTIFGAREITVFDQKWYYAFYAVPYAQAPIGRLRFQNPKSLKENSKPFDASTEYHGACAQAHIVYKHALYGTEDCLHLNIYTPYLPKHQHQDLKSVIVWIHGYAFTSSFSHIYGSDFLIENDILFVSLTHRIGVFGFFRANDTDTNINMGLNDIIMGLKWIRRNIQYFGGDKEKVTLMCSGSACTLASILLLTKNKKLFQKLIMHSGTLFSPSIYQGFSPFDSIKLHEEIRKAGYKDIMAASTQALVAASRKIYSSKHIINSQRPLVPFSPVIENISINSLKSSLLIEKKNITGEAYSLPLMIGYTSQEGMTEVIPFISNPSHLKSLSSSFKFMVPFSDGCKYNFTSDTYSKIAGIIKRQYAKKEFKITIEDFMKYLSDIHKYPIFKFLNYYQLKLNKRKIFVYKFNYDSIFNVIKSTSLAGVNFQVKGAAHGDELCYILKCEPAWENYVKIKDDFYNRDRMFIKQITAKWANFAKFGDPTPKNQNSDVTWLPTTISKNNLLLFGKRNKLIDFSMEKKMTEFWDKLYYDYYSSKNCEKKHDEL